MTALVRGVALGVTPAGPDPDTAGCAEARADGYAPTCGHLAVEHFDNTCPEEDDVSAVYIDGQGDLWEDTGLLHAPNDPVLLLLDGTGITYPRSDVNRIWGGITPITPGGDDRAVPRQPQLRAGA